MVKNLELVAIAICAGEGTALPVDNVYNLTDLSHSAGLKFR
jgi:hypothetical protein